MGRRGNILAMRRTMMFLQVKAQGVPQTNSHLIAGVERTVQRHHYILWVAWINASIYSRISSLEEYYVAIS